MIRQEWLATVHSDRFLLKSAAYSIKKLGFSQCSTLDAQMEIAGMITQNDSTNQQKHFSMGLYTIHHQYIMANEQITIALWHRNVPQTARSVSLCCWTRMESLRLSTCPVAARAVGWGVVMICTCRARVLKIVFTTTYYYHLLSLLTIFLTEHYHH